MGSKQQENRESWEINTNVKRRMTVIYFAVDEFFQWLNIQFTEEEEKVTDTSKTDEEKWQEISKHKGWLMEPPLPLAKDWVPH